MIPTEEQIRSSWEGSSNVRVSICCTTYNHEAYIEETLKGFLVQSTQFPFEIIVHDYNIRSFLCNLKTSNNFFCSDKRNKKDNSINFNSINNSFLFKFSPVEKFL